jgi:S-adenosylmethionine hydrolase
MKEITIQMAFAAAGARTSLVVLLVSFFSQVLPGQNRVVVFQSDFGTRDGAVSAMKGVAIGVDPELRLFDLTHEIPAYNIWEAAVRLQQTVPFWPEGTVFVSVVDPGVGTDRKPVVAKTKSGHFIVTPDNGTLTLLAQSPGISAVRVIDQRMNRRDGSYESYTFEGRDVFAYTAARLAGGFITFQQVGPPLFGFPVRIPFQEAGLYNDVLSGNIYILDIQYGNLWTNIPEELVRRLRVRFGQVLHLTITHQNVTVYEGDMPYCRSFGEVETGKPLAYLNSLMQLSFAINQGSFSQTWGIGSGSDWKVEITTRRKD